MPSKPSSKKSSTRKGKDDLPTPGAFNERQRWTRDDVRILRQYYPTKGSRWVARKLGRTHEAIQLKAQNIGLKSEAMKEWTRKELTYLCRNYHKRPILEIAEHLGRTPRSVAGQLEALRRAMKRNPETPFRLQPKLRHRGWTEEQLRFIRRNYGLLSATEIARQLGMDVGKVTCKAYSLGLTRSVSTKTAGTKYKDPLTETQRKYVLENMGDRESTEIARHLGIPHARVLRFIRSHGEIHDVERRLWTPKEIEFVRNNFGTMLVKDIARRIGRTPSAILRKAQRIGLPMEEGFYDKSRRWTVEDEQLLRELYPVQSMQEIAKRLGRTKGSVTQHAVRMKLHQHGGSFYKRTRQWTQEEERLLRKLYPTHSAREIAELLGRARHSVIGHVQKLGLTGKGKKSIPS